jgi:glycosyltransferase involved in cell wall biosynthesis
MKPRFSIAIPAYNRPAYLSQAIASALAQTIDNFEVVVSDDCSVDALASVVASFNDSRITYHRSPDRLGAARNHQLAVDLSRGDYVVNLHSDDLLLPNCLEVAGSELDACESAAALYSSVAYLREGRIEGCQEVPKIRFADRRVFLENPWLEKFHNVAPTSCMFRRSAFVKVGGYRVALRFAYDWELFMRFMTIGGGVLFSREVLSVYRRHEEQASHTSSDDGLYDIIDLWQLKEYSHWRSSEIADLVLTALRTRARFAGCAEVLGEVGRRGATVKILRGMPAALFRRSMGVRENEINIETNYESPARLQTAISAASALASGLKA